MRRGRPTFLGGGAATPLVALGVALSIGLGVVLAVDPGGSAPAASSLPPVPLSPSGSFTDTSVACPGVSIYPSPGSRTASPSTQVAFRGIAPAELAGATVSVVGSVSGAHPGRFVADSDGKGASFYPSTPFQPGETVTVAIPYPICGATGDTASFQVSRPVQAASDQGAEATGGSQPSTPTSDLQHFQSEPALQPPVLTVDQADPSSEGDFFLNPKGGTAAGGPMIVDGDGRLVWFDPLPLGVNSSDLRVQSFDGQPVLTWWQGQVVSGHGVGEDVIMNDHYQIIDTVKAADGYSADLHEFLLGTGETAWITAYSEIHWNLSAVGGSSDGATLDGVVQEIDIATGNVLFEWDSLDHVSPALSEVAYKGAASGPDDYFHVNAIDPSGQGTVLISSRNTDAVYLVDIATGNVVWRLGGKASSFTMGPGTEFALQHDARLRGSSIVTIFDDEDNGNPARLIAIGLNLKSRTANLVWAQTGPGELAVTAQGNFQLLGDGDVVAGWGSGSGSPVTEYTGSGGLLFEAQLPDSINSYRAFRFDWSGLPVTAPSAAARRSGSGTDVYASWNGSTATATWTVLGGESPTALSPLASVRAADFETTIHLSGAPAYVEVEAVSAGGAVLASSPATRVASGS